MREIKFRAWDKVNKRMFMVDEIHNLWSMHDMWDNENSELKMRPHLFVIEQIFKDADTDNKLHVPDEAEIMQFTGLHDKNGKPIYESDIVDNGNGGCYVYWNDVHYQFWVGFDSQEDSFHSPLSEFEGELEVIGNKFEHKALLQ